MKIELEILEKNLKEFRPELYSQFNPPLAETEINTLCSKYKIKLPKDIITLYSWKNGQSEDSFESFVNNSQFIALEEVLKEATEMTAMIGLDFEIENWWNKDWLPIFNNGNSDSICYDMGGAFNGKNGQILEFWHEDNDRDVIAPNLITFIKKINEYYKTTPKNKYDSYFEIKKIDGYPKKINVKKPIIQKNKTSKSYFSIKEGVPPKFWEIIQNGKILKIYSGKLGEKVLINEKKLNNKVEADSEYDKMIRYSLINGFIETEHSYVNSIK